MVETRWETHTRWVTHEPFLINATARSRWGPAARPTALRPRRALFKLWSLCRSVRWSNWLKIWRSERHTGHGTSGSAEPLRPLSCSARRIRARTGRTRAFRGVVDRIREELSSERLVEVLHLGSRGLGQAPSGGGWRVVSGRRKCSCCWIHCCDTMWNIYNSYLNIPLQLGCVSIRAEMSFGFSVVERDPSIHHAHAHTHTHTHTPPCTHCYEDCCQVIK